MAGFRELRKRSPILKKANVLIFALFIACVVISASAQTVAGNNDGPGPGPDGPHGPNGPPTSVTEPAAIALLGAGLVSLGIYAKRKRGKKQ
jgi:hypothetical protein